MSIIVNNDKLVCIITNYGLSRISKAIGDPSVSLNLSKIKVGDANGEYYNPEPDQTALLNPISNGEFFVIKKALLEDGQTVSFQCVIPSSFGDCDIREVGLYETVNEVDYLFAIVVQQPIVKPSLANRYIMSIDYFMFLKSANLADVYDQIILNPEEQTATEQDLQDLLSTLLFTQGNLSVQIGQNSEIIGYNRASEVYSFVEQSRSSYGYIASCSSYVSFGRYTNNNVFGYWIFDYPKRNESYKSIKDIGSNGYNISTSQNVNLYEKVYEGITSTLAFPSPTYFYIDASIPLSLVNSAGTADLPFSMMFVVSPLSVENDRTLLARSNYSTNSNTFEIKELSDGSLQIKLFTDSSNYITFTSDINIIPNSCHALLLSYDNSDNTFVVFLNGKLVTLTKVVTGTYTHMFNSTTTLFSYEYTPVYAIYTLSPSTFGNTDLYNEDGSLYEGTVWTADQNQVFYNGMRATYTQGSNKQTDYLYAWSYDNGVDKYTIYTKEYTITANTRLYNADYTEYTGTSFYIELYGSSYTILYNSYMTEHDGSEDIDSKTLYAWLYQEGIQRIWANSSSAPTVLFNSDGTIYQEDNIWMISEGNVIYKPNNGIAEYNSEYNITSSNLDTTSYIVNANGNIIDTVNSSVGLVGIALDKMTTEDMRVFSLELCAQIGLNPCISPS